MCRANSQGKKSLEKEGGSEERGEGRVKGGRKETRETTVSRPERTSVTFV